MFRPLGGSRERGERNGRGEPRKASVFKGESGEQKQPGRWRQGPAKGREGQNPNKKKKKGKEEGQKKRLKWGSRKSEGTEGARKREKLWFDPTFWKKNLKREGGLLKGGGKSAC